MVRNSVCCMSGMGVSKEMTDCIIGIGFIIAVVAMLAVGVWQTRKNCKEQRLNSQVIYALYKELRRYNDTTFGEGGE